MGHPVAFSTLACPDWSIETVVAYAAAFGYDGIEWRGGTQGHVGPAMPLAARVALRRISAEAGIRPLAVTAYTSLVSDDPREREANVDELQRYADLAADLGAPYVRAFLGRWPKNASLDLLYERAANCLEATAESTTVRSDLRGRA